jgi:hypothetical protein
VFGFDQKSSYLCVIKNNYMKVKCDYCGKDFEKEPRRVNESNNRG